MSTLWQLRRATEADLHALLALQISSPLSPQWSESAWVGYLSAPTAAAREWRCAFVLEEDGDLLGFIAGSALGSIAELESIAVSESCRQRGIGGQLLGEWERWARRRGASTAELEVRESNAVALAFYTSVGFSAQGRRPRYYQDPVEDALLLHKALAPAR